MTWHPGSAAPRILAVATVSAALFAAGCSASSPKAAPSSSSSASSSATSSSPAPQTSTPTTSTGASSTTAVPKSCQASGTPTSGQSSESFDFLGVQRTYQLYVPRSYRGSRPAPLVFDFHGFGSNAAQQMVYGSFQPEADRDGFLIVAPDGQVPSDRHFNLTAEKGLQNDVQMVAALLAQIEKTFCVDSHRVYATGMSDGGAMTSALACEMSDRFAAFGPVAVVVACGGSRPVPIMGFAGTADPVVPFDGGRVNCCGGAKVAGARAAMAAWAAHDHCSPAFVDVRVSSEVVRRTWPGCAPGTSVTFYIIEGGGHTWPGSIPIASLGKTTKEIDASATIWTFFRAQSLA